MVEQTLWGAMPDTVNGLPLHPLVVHAVVVLLPLAALGVLALSVWAPWRRRYGPPVVALAVLAAAAIPVATASGENLERLVGDPGRHAELGDTMIWFAVPLALASIALVWLDRWPVHTRRAEAVAVAAGAHAAPAPPAEPVAGRRPARPSGLMAAVAVLAALLAVANIVQVVRVGDSGARAAWGDVVHSGGHS